MIYLDYSATTPINKEVLDTYIKVSTNFIGNSNSLHKLGIEAKKLEEEATEQIKNILNLKDKEIIYTSCSSESNNLAIKGIALRNKKRGKHIITTNLEHSSIYGPIGYLQTNGFEVDIVKTNELGLVDLDDLKSLINENTILVTIGAVNSETGVRQDIESLGLFLKDYPCYFHVDATQAVGKINIDYRNVDLISFSAHKFFGPKGIGVLIKNKNVLIEPLIHGGKSTTIYRSGTPALPLIASFSKSLRLAVQNLEEENIRIKKINDKIKNNLKQYENVVINSNEVSIPHILNFSILNLKPETLQHALEKYEVYISTQSACSANNSVSKSVLEVTKNETLASHSVRVSISKITTEDEIDKFLDAFSKCYQELNIR